MNKYNSTKMAWLWDLLSFTITYCFFWKKISKVKNNIEVDVKVRCIEKETTHVQIAEGIDTTKSYLIGSLKRRTA